MRILYGVNGEGLGHATRSEVVIGSLLNEHDVRVMASGAAFKYLEGRLGHGEVFGPSFAMDHGGDPLGDGQAHDDGRRAELPGACGAGWTWSTSGDRGGGDRLRAALGHLRALVAHAARLRRQHPHDRPLPHDEEITEGAREDYRIARAGRARWSRRPATT